MPLGEKLKNSIKMRCFRVNKVGRTAQAACSCTCGTMQLITFCHGGAKGDRQAEIHTACAQCFAPAAALV